MNSTVKFVSVTLASLISISSAFAASDAESRAACKKLYVGQAITDKEYQLGMVIIGIGEKMATIRVVSAKNPKEIGTIEEFTCTGLLKDAGG
jgi:hypothetical protein